MFELLLTMLERLGIIVTVAFLMTRLPFFRQLINRQQIDRRQQIFAILFFGFFGIIGTYTGLTFSTDTNLFNRWITDLSESEAIANSRVIGIVMAGLLGGYKVGIGAGLIAGVHRMSLGGFTAFSCGFSSIIAGLLAAYIRSKYKSKRISVTIALLTGALAESIQMVIILLTSAPFDRALVLVESIGIPMILANGIGSALFFLIILSLIKEEEKAGAVQAQKALSLAENTLSHLRKGLTLQSAEATCKIIYREVDASAVSMTDQNQILAHIGIGDDHHRPLSPIQTHVTKQVLQSGELLVAGKDSIHCTHPGCPLGAVVIAPLKKRDITVGTLKFYFPAERDINNIVIQLIKGLSSLMSHQLEISDAEEASKLANEAEIKALQAQISPHFLFNSLNIIVSLIRTNPIKARKLLVSLSHFFRQNLSATTVKWTTLQDELKHVQAYLSVEEARFIDKLDVEYRIDENVLHYLIPPLSLQPIVENAVKHGIKDMERNSKVQISIKEHDHRIEIQITDNGKGIPKERMDLLGEELVSSASGTGFGLYNINKRLIMMFGRESQLHFRSQPGKGTTVLFFIDKRLKKDDWNE
ncbi:two-component system sensor histidine kinase LytS [Bacillus tianshenii]|uniref:histidine kinase n=1 Tax=Sutcliffiella tianshenii TaxID=1463404 RepID=A0ABS2NY11_9BACI|nr:sensor histidine kinase [Bacillus tianshenii]MBM7619403.1 two-component system sensor histidine kinase LytS [Bacillus tianshenii]